MFKSDKKEVFSFRKYKGYGLASAVIAAFFFASSVSADVVNNGDGTTTLSNDKASVVVDTSKFKDIIQKQLQSCLMKVLMTLKLLRLVKS